MSAQVVEIHNEPTHLIGERGDRELAVRGVDGLRVQLLWDPIADSVTVAVDDLHAGQRFHVAIARERALDAFYHPFVYAA